MDTNELIGRLTGGLLGAIFGYITWERVADTVVTAGIGAFVTGVVGFFVTMTLQKIFIKKDKTNK